MLLASATHAGARDAAATVRWVRLPFPVLSYLAGCIVRLTRRLMLPPAAGILKFEIVISAEIRQDLGSLASPHDRC